VRATASGILSSVARGVIGLNSTHWLRVIETMAAVTMATVSWLPWDVLADFF